MYNAVATWATLVYKKYLNREIITIQAKGVGLRSLISSQSIVRLSYLVNMDQKPLWTISWLIQKNKHRERSYIGMSKNGGKEDQGGFFTGLRTKPTASKHW